MAPIAIQAEIVKGHHPATLLYSEFYSTNNPTLMNNNNNNNNKDHEKDNSNQEEEDTLELLDVDCTASFWDIMTCFSILLLWLHGFVTALQSLLVSHCGRLLMRNNNNNNNHETTTTKAVHQENRPEHGARKYFHLFQSLLLGNTAAIAAGSAAAAAQCSANCHHHQHHHHHKQQVDGSWPPPGLVALAILTVVALVVHPDGMTWIMLRKIRDTMVSILQSSTTCWAIMIRDYGVVVGTVSASASIILVLILAIAMHKAFLSNCCGSLPGTNNKASCSTNASSTGSSTKRRTTAAEKKRRRRKGKNNARGRIKAAGNSNSSANGNAHHNQALSSRLPKVEEVASDGASRSSGGSSSSISNGVVVKEQPAAPKPESVYSPAMTSCFEESSLMTSPSALESVVSSDDFCDGSKGRTPVPSVCTVDTTSMSDDISCSSFSVRSAQQQQPPSRPTTSNRAIVSPTPMTSSKGKGKTAKTCNNNNNNTSKASQRGQKQNKQVNGKLPPPTPANTAMSRAEALKMAKPVPKFNMTDNRFGNPNNIKSQKHPIPVAAPTGSTSRTTNVAQIARGTRGAKGKKAAATKPPTPTKNLAVPARTVSPVPTTLDSPVLVSTTPSPRANAATTIVSGAPSVSSPSLNNNNFDLISGLINSSNDANNNRSTPFSPTSQSLFSCEIGASSWGLPTLPVVSQPKNVAAASVLSATASTTTTSPPAQSYTTPNPFVTPYSQMPAVTDNNSLGLWNTPSPSTARSVTPPMNPLGGGGSLSTPKRPLRAPPGLSAPPGFAPVQPLLQPTLTNTTHNSIAATDLYTPVRNFDDSPSLIPSTPSTTSTLAEASPFSWNSSTPLVPGLRSGSSSPLMMMSTPAIQKNPFAGDNNNNNNCTNNASEVECRIEAELQELGGRMVGSVLDF